MHTDSITYCVPSTPCANIGCYRHQSHAPTNIVGIAVADLWATCSIREEYKLPYPVHVKRAG